MYSKNKGEYTGPKSLAKVFLDVANTLQELETLDTQKRNLENRLRSVFPQSFASTPPNAVVLRVPIDPRVYTPQLESKLQELFLNLDLQGNSG